MNTSPVEYDYIVIGSGFGGSVSALRLAEKGYKVLVLEKGKKLQAQDFPKTNWNLKKWLWLPFLKFHGLMRMSFFRHVSILSGVGVGGGSLVYANTLPMPKSPFFRSPSWSHLADWEKELKPFYEIAKRMLGVTQNPHLDKGDIALQTLAKNLGMEDKFEPTQVAVYFGESGKKVKDPYFQGEGPDRAGCTFCGGCMLGCRYNAKNTLDKNYLYFAEKKGAKIQAESEVYDIIPIDGNDGSSGYRVKWKNSTTYFSKKGEFTTKGIVFSGGVLGTVNLLLRLKKKSLPKLSNRVGYSIRTNSESIIPITSLNKDDVYSNGIAIGSILHTDENSHLEPVRYSAGSGFWRLMLVPMVVGNTIFSRVGKLFLDIILNPIRNLKAFFVDDWSKRTQTMLFMQTLDSTLRFQRSWLGMKTAMDQGKKPSAFIPEGIRLFQEYAKIVNGKPFALANEAILGIPSTAHILGGAAMGKDAEEGVIDKTNHVFGYQNMLVCDGSMISANIGVNPSLTITAISERAMSFIQQKQN